MEIKISETEEALKEFKDGVADGLINGNAKESSREHYYKQGYDFGIALYNELEGESED